MNTTTQERALILFLRLAIGWTFLYAAITQFADPAWSAAGFLNSTKTFHWLMAGFAAPNILPITNFLVRWGHLLIGLSLISGLLVRASAPLRNSFDAHILHGTYGFSLYRESHKLHA